MSTTAIIHWTNGTNTEVPVSAVKEYRRNLGHNIARVEIKGGEAAPSVAPKVVKTEEKKAEAANVEDNGPSMDWTKAQLQEYCNANDIEYQSNDTKKMLLTFIEAAK